MISPNTRLAIHIFLHGALIATLLVLAGCATTSARPTKNESVSEKVVRPTPAAAEQDTGTSSSDVVDSIATNESADAKPKDPYASNPATVTLRKQASNAIAADNQQQAVRLLERALRIDPRDPATYYLFAKLRQQQEQESAALQLIDKGLSLRPGAALRDKLEALRDELSPAVDS